MPVNHYDPGINPAIQHRAERKTMGVEPVYSGDKRRVIDTIDRLLETGIGNKKFLGNLRRSVKRAGHEYLMTARQLEALNALLVKRGLAKVSCAVYDKQLKKRRFQAFKEDLDAVFAERKANLPKKPPGR